MALPYKLPVAFDKSFSLIQYQPNLYDARRPSALIPGIIFSWIGYTTFRLA